jgi:hypothetical protein
VVLVVVRLEAQFSISSVAQQALRVGLTPHMPCRPLYQRQPQNWAGLQRRLVVRPRSLWRDMDS